MLVLHFISSFLSKAEQSQAPNDDIEIVIETLLNKDDVLEEKVENNGTQGGSLRFNWKVINQKKVLYPDLS